MDGEDEEELPEAGRGGEGDSSRGTGANCSGPRSSPSMETCVCATASARHHSSSSAFRRLSDAAYASYRAARAAVGRVFRRPHSVRVLPTRLRRSSEVGIGEFAVSGQIEFGLLQAALRCGVRLLLNRCSAFGIVGSECECVTASPRHPTQCRPNSGPGNRGQCTRWIVRLQLEMQSRGLNHREGKETEGRESSDTIHRFGRARSSSRYYLQRRAFVATGFANDLRGVSPRVDAAAHEAEGVRLNSFEATPAPDTVHDRRPAPKFLAGFRWSASTMGKEGHRSAINRTNGKCIEKCRDGTSAYGIMR
jgi:hypothetical protein